MKFRATSLPLVSLAFLGLGFSDAPKAMATNPYFPTVATALTPQGAQTLYQIDFLHTHLFKMKAGDQSLHQSYWTPIEADIHQAEFCLETYARADAYVSNSVSDPLGYRSYNISLTHQLRQYAGVKRGGERFILINGCMSLRVPIFATAVGEQAVDYDWPRLHGRVFGDGAVIFESYEGEGSSFRAAYDLTTHRIVYLAVDNFVEQSQQPPSGGLARCFG